MIITHCNRSAVALSSCLDIFGRGFIILVLGFDPALMVIGGERLAGM